MQPQVFDVPAALQDTVKSLWHTSIDFGSFPAGYEILPDGYAEIIFYFGSTCRVATPAGELPLPSPFVMGLLGQPATLHAAGRVAILGVKCFPWAVFALLGLPPGKGGVRLLAHPIAQLQAPLALVVQAGELAAAAAQVAQYLLAARARLGPNRLLAKAGEAMRAAQGSLPVSQVAAAAHATVRTLERQFKESSGHTVKDVSGLMRFEQVRNRLWLHPATNLAGLAHELGYVDQAHLSREFKRYSGTTPAAFARKARRGPPAAGADFVAFVQA